LKIGAENFHLYFRTAWQLNMAERQAKHTTLPRVLFPISLQSVANSIPASTLPSQSVSSLSTGNKGFNSDVALPLIVRIHSEGKKLP
jgi:hypothetical protein